VTHATTVSEKDLSKVLMRLRDIRAWAVRVDMDPWAFRQALLLVLHIDTACALERGVSREHLESFDSFVAREAQAWVQRLPR